MAETKAVIFDFIGTLVNLRGYSLEKAEDRLFRSLLESGLNLHRERFFVAYNKAYRRHREIRYQQLIEVTNAVWISEALNQLGFQVAPDDVKIKTAVNHFFENYLAALALRSSARQVLVTLHQRYKLGLVSNFTYFPVIYAALRKLEIGSFFDAVVVSDAEGWRKPSSRPFRKVLSVLSIEPGEAFFVGDTFLEDIHGAKEAGMKAIFISSPFTVQHDDGKSLQQPDYVIGDLKDIREILDTQ
ncbi:MAG: HAD family hydrolase [Candidatus Bathyarchaeota archaeon]|nr:MAG: HAD family hydrolase [Candidatus Bathyarchaeota archaeon]